MTYMTIKIVGIQANHPSKLNPKSDTSVFLAVEAQRLNYKIFHYDPKDLSIINDRVLAKGFFIWSILFLKKLICIDFILLL